MALLRDRRTDQTDQSAQKQTHTHRAVEVQQEVGGDRTASSTNGAGANGCVQKEKKNLNLNSHPVQKLMQSGSQT